MPASNSNRDNQKLANSFADPNSLDDQKLGNAFVETNSSKKKKHHEAAPPNKKPINGRVLLLFILAVVVVFLLIFLLGFLPRHSRNKEIEARAKDQKRTPSPQFRCSRSSARRIPLASPSPAPPLR